MIPWLVPHDQVTLFCYKYRLIIYFSGTPPENPTIKVWPSEGTIPSAVSPLSPYPRASNSGRKSPRRPQTLMPFVNGYRLAKFEILTTFIQVAQYSIIGDVTHHNACNINETFFSNQEILKLLNL